MARYLLKKRYFLYCLGLMLNMEVELMAFENIEDFNLQQLRNFRQPYNSSLNLLELQESLSEYQSAFGVPLDVYDKRILYPQGCHVLLLKNPRNGNKIKAIFKPRNNLIQKVSIGAFYTAQYLGMKTKVPPLCSYVYQDVEGIISYFVDTNLHYSFWDISGDYELIKNQVCPRCLSDYYIFSYLFGNWDLKWKNTVIFDNQGISDIVCIDIDAIAYPGLGDYGKHFFVPWVKISAMKIPHASFSEEDSFYLKIEDIYSYLDLLFPFFESNNKEVQRELIMSKKYALISKLAKSYSFWERPTMKHYIDETAWWIRIYENVEGVAPAFAEFADEETIERLKSLNINILKTLFNDLDPKNSIIDEGFYIGILERRNAMCRALKSTNYNSP